MKKLLLNTLLPYIKSNLVISIKTSGGFVHIKISIADFDILNRSMPFVQKLQGKSVQVDGEVIIRHS